MYCAQKGDCRNAWISHRSTA
eukprot:COSAG06_NODE_49604_length_324_cov_0.800000_2_plen_20_part_01